MSEDNKGTWTGRSTTGFRVFNWELFVKPRRWIMAAGLVVMAGCSSLLLYEMYSGNEKQKEVEHKKRILQLAREIKNKEQANDNNDKNELQ